MERNLIYKFYDFFNHIVHPGDLKISNTPKIRRCPVTGLDISMQPKNTKFLSISGIKWYYRYEREIYHQFLGIRLSKNLKKETLEVQFKGIAHSIRNAESNPRNNTRKAIQKLLQEKNSLFNNIQLIDQSKLKEAGM